MQEHGLATAVPVHVHHLVGGQVHHDLNAFMLTQETSTNLQRDHGSKCYLHHLETFRGVAEPQQAAVVRTKDSIRD